MEDGSPQQNVSGAGEGGQGQEYGCERGEERKKTCKRQAGLDTQTQGCLWTEPYGGSVRRSHEPRTASSTSSQSPAHHQRGTAEPGVLVTPQPRTAVPLPPLTPLASSRPAPLPQITNIPQPELFTCWFALPPARKIGQLPASQFKRSLPSLTSWAEANP